MALLKTFIIVINLIIQILCTYRQEAYKFFDKFTLVDLVNLSHKTYIIVKHLPQTIRKKKLFNV